MVTGGADGRVILWKGTPFGVKRASTIDIATLGAGPDTGSGDDSIQARPPIDPRIRSVCISPDSPHQFILVGTFGCELYVAVCGSRGWVVQNDAVASSRVVSDRGAQQLFPMALVACGHAGHESRAMACHPSFPDVFATCGDDHTLRLWSIS